MVNGFIMHGKAQQTKSQAISSGSHQWTVEKLAIISQEGRLSITSLFICSFVSLFQDVYIQYIHRCENKRTSHPLQGSTTLSNPLKKEYI